MNATTIKTFFIRFLTIFAILLIASCQTAPTKTASNTTSGFGGTGKLIAHEDTDSLPTSGFGGTGVQLGQKNQDYTNTLFIGTITAFGSVWVNGVEIEYPQNARVRSALASDAENVNALKLGQQIILRTQTQKTPTTDDIEIYYPFAGAIQAVETNRIRVNQTWVETNDLTQADQNLQLATGNYIAVNAYQNRNGEWVATRLNKNPQHVSWTLPALQTNVNTQAQKVVLQQGLNALLVRNRIRVQTLEQRPLSQTPMPLRKGMMPPIPMQEQQRLLQQNKLQQQQRQNLQQQMQIKQMHKDQRQLQQELIQQQQPSVRMVQPRPAQPQRP